jgi:hypothetical protein
VPVGIITLKDLMEELMQVGSGFGGLRSGIAKMTGA